MRKKYNFSLFYRLFFVFAITVYSSCNLNQPNTTDFKNSKSQIGAFKTKAHDDKFYFETTGANLFRWIENDEFPIHSNDIPISISPNTEVIDVTKYFRPGYRLVWFSLTYNGEAGPNGWYYYDVKIKRNDKVLFQDSFSYGGYTPNPPLNPMRSLYFWYDLKYINLGITNTTLNTTSGKSIISLTPTNKDINWTLNVTGRNYDKTYKNKGDFTVDFPDGLNVNDMQPGEYNVTASYDDEADKATETGVIIRENDEYAPVLNETTSAPFGIKGPGVQTTIDLTKSCVKVN